MVHTCSSLPESDNGSHPLDDPGKHLRCDWSEADETRFIEFLVGQKSRAGNSATFKDSIFKAAAEHMEETRMKGGPKTLETCRAKWARVCSIVNQLIVRV